MFLVGLTGGIAAGKSTVASVFAQAGGIIIDADQLARDAVLPGSGTLTLLAREFGNDILSNDGTLNRALLAERAFIDESSVVRLNQIVHPEVQRLFESELEEINARDANAIVVYDVPLLFEARRADEFDFIVVVEAPDDLRVERLIELRHMTAKEALHRVTAQASNEQRRTIADALIDSSGTLAQTIAAAQAVWKRIKTAAHHPDGTRRAN